MSQLVLRCVNGGTVALDKKPWRVWTWIGDQKPELPVVMQHGINGGLDDYMHDWQWRDGVLRWYGHYTTKGEEMWLVVEFEEAS